MCCSQSSFSLTVSPMSPTRWVPEAPLQGQLPGATGVLGPGLEPSSICGKAKLLTVEKPSSPI